MRDKALAPVAARQAGSAPELGRIPLPARFMLHIDAPVYLAKNLLRADALAQRVLPKQHFQAARGDLALFKLTLHRAAATAVAIRFGPGEAAVLPSVFEVARIPVRRLVEVVVEDLGGSRLPRRTRQSRNKRHAYRCRFWPRLLLPCRCDYACKQQ